MSTQATEYATLVKRQANRLGQLAKVLSYAEDATEDNTCLTVVEKNISKLNNLYQEHASIIMEMYKIDDSVVDDINTLETRFDEQFCQARVMLISLRDEFQKSCLPVNNRPEQKDVDSVETLQGSLDAYCARYNEGYYDTALVQEIQIDITSLESIRQEHSHFMNIVITAHGDDENKKRLRNRLQKFQFRWTKLVSCLEVAKSQKTAGSTPSTTASAPVNPVPARASIVKTERIPLPAFDGTPEKWVKFRDMFKSLIHESSAYSNIEKFHYLESSMKLPTSESNILNKFAHSADNYEKAWTAVCERYDDKRKLLHHHLSSLLSIKKMTNASAVELRRIIDSYDSHISSLAQLGFELKPSDPYPNLLFVFLVTRCLDEETLREWKKDNECDTPAYEDLKKYLIALWRSLDDLPSNKKPPTKAPELKPNRSGKSHVGNTEKSSNGSTCPMCNEQHRLWNCDKFRKASASERFNIVKDKKLCINCFSDGHRASNCTSKSKCKTCDKQHNTLLHFGSTSSDPRSSVPQPSAPTLSPNVAPFQPYTMTRKTLVGESDEAGTSAHSSSAFLANRKQTLLSTVQVYAVDSSGNNHLCRALLDSGSDTCFVTSSFAKQLKLELRKVCYTITGIDEKTTTVKHKTTSVVKSRYGPFECKMDLSVLSNITGMLPNISLDRETVNIPDGFFLADPHFHKAAHIDMLISADFFYESLLSEKIKLPNGIMMLETKFGWILGGTITSNALHQTSLLSCFHHKETNDDEIGKKLEMFLKADDFEFAQPSLTAEEKHCEKVFMSTTTRDDQGRFVVHMPFKANSTSLGHNLANAKRALSWQEKRRQKDVTYNNLYVEYMEDYITTGHMQEVESAENEEAYYLPHHGVVKMSSTTTKLRPVFNASSASETGISLNDVLCVGPTVQPESFDILLRFREKRFVITGDITKMYRQIWVNPSQRKYLRILWRSDLTEPIKHYQLNTVTFGTSCAPYLATRVIRQLAIDNKATFPEASEIIRNSFYVDDLLFGIDSIEQGIQLRDHIRYILILAGLPLCKISANHPELLSDLTTDLIANQDDKDTHVTKTLGIVFDASKDQFSYQLKSESEGELTKAKVLSEIASIYDPIGWIAPVVLTAKLFLKKLWLMKLQWKDVLPSDLQHEWNQFREKLQFVNNVSIRRHCFIENHVTVELHGFSDASTEAYGAIIYAHSWDQCGNNQTSLICAKSRVAPKSQKTLARLELCGATLLAKLVSRIYAIFSTSIQEVTLWSDSTITLSWISISTSRLTTFVANRVAVIQELTHEYTWKHIRGSDNPADIISRGLNPDEIADSTMWWNGPSFFTLPKSEWPSSIITVNEADPEIVQELKKSLIVSKPNDMFEYIESKFSNVRTLRRVVAFIKRFVHNSRKNAPRRIGPLSVDEIDAAEVTIIMIIQQTLFPHEFKLLKPSLTSSSDSDVPMTTQLPRKSQLISLSPFIGTDGLIRVGGRIRASNELSTNQKHPIILPSCHFTKILLRELHKKYAHPGPLLMRSIVRENYYPLKDMTIIRKIIHECIVCFRFKSSASNQYMSDLPVARVTMTPPFTNTAVDYAGYYTIRTSITQRSSTTKAYISLFKCMCTNAVHLELVSDLSANAFIAALDRFISRRGHSIALFTDNATCFEGANNELKRIIESCDEEVKQYCVEQSIKWTFTTPRAPHAGGVYESGIKLMKHHLKRIMEDRNYTYEQFTTILCKVEAIVNSRPITPMNENPLDLEVLTPGHFLTGRSLVAKPEKNFLFTPTSHLNRWEGLQQVQQRFWSIWYHDYLNTLQTRPVNFREQFAFNVGDMVLVHDSNLPPLKWLIGRIVKLFPGKDKVIRNVRIITKHGEKDRHVKYLRLLPFINQSSSAGESVANATKV